MTSHNPKTAAQNSITICKAVIFTTIPLLLIKDWVLHWSYTPIYYLFPPFWGLISLIFLKRLFPRFFNEDALVLHPPDQYRHATMTLVGGAITYLIILLIRLANLSQRVSTPVRLSSSMIVGFGISLLAAFTEEVFFRQILITTLIRLPKKPLHFGAAIFIQAALWAGLHVQYYDTPLNLMVVFILGVYFGTLYYFSQNLTLCIVFHLCNNIIGSLSAILLFFV